MPSSLTDVAEEIFIIRIVVILTSSATAKTDFSLEREI